MDMLVELGLVRPLYLNEPTQRFISAMGGHHHLVCHSCGETVEFDECATSELAAKLAERYNFQFRATCLNSTACARAAADLTAA